MKRIICTCVLVLVLALSQGAAIADDYYWDKKIAGSSRFRLVLDGEAVLDRETGLVWQRYTGSFMKWVDTADPTPVAGACTYCYQLELGGRMGWRLPTIEELATLVDTSNSNPALPTGHLFTNPEFDSFWSSSTCASDPDRAWYVEFYSGGVSNYYKTYPN